MIKPKYIIISAAIAFVFSFLISIVATHGFGISFLRGIIFAVVFGLIALGVEFVYFKWLAGDEPNVDLEALKVHKKNDKAGNVVDIVLDEENLTEEKDTAEFKIDDTKKRPIDSEALAESKIAEEEHEIDLTQNFNSKSPEKTKKIQANMESVSLDEFESSGSPAQPANAVTFENIADVEEIKPAAEVPQETFQPVNLAKESYSTKKEVQNEQIPNAAPIVGADKNVSSNSVSSELDDLPDLGGLTLQEKTSDDSVIDTSEFAQESEADINFSKPKVSEDQVTKANDSETMAAAIRTLLNS